MTIEDIQSKFVNSLIQNGIDEKEAIRISTTFFLAWVKTQNKKNLNPQRYTLAVEDFLTRFKGTI